eukprot:m.73201 g.73201  ORF g.73201 m.73201 type:complete len:70 (-) comp14326_c0_seq1:121-330(-)
MPHVTFVGQCQFDLALLDLFVFANFLDLAPHTRKCHRHGCGSLVTKQYSLSSAMLHVADRVGGSVWCVV